MLRTLVLLTVAFLPALALAQEELPPGKPTTPPPPPPTPSVLADQPGEASPAPASEAAPAGNTAEAIVDRAEQLLEQGQHAAAIELFGVASKSTEDAELQRRAHFGRAHALMLEDPVENLEAALAAREAGGEPGIPLEAARSSSLKVETRVVGQVRPGEVVLVEKLAGDWAWVTSVEGDAGRRGWLKRSAFLSGSQTPRSEPRPAYQYESTIRVGPPRPPFVYPYPGTMQFRSPYSGRGFRFRWGPGYWSWGF